ncbi:MAG TPA: thiamine phosphate synthase [Allosphingosinicella sp.]|uniref:thiamine phosphate synthase n=1 Tax=Allosphingosinicella sp. TaxID=2823234 RepID=UPI002EDACFFB
MDRRQPLPRLWMMSDERQGESLLPALRRLPPGAGIVFRHYSLPSEERRALFDEAFTIAREVGSIMLLAAPPAVALEWGADGSHGWEGAATSGLLRSVSVHDEAEMLTANRFSADLAFVSPVFETRSHPGAAVLGMKELTRLSTKAQMPVIALGGMNAERAKLLEGTGIYGWAAIDAWSEA